MNRYKSTIIRSIIYMLFFHTCRASSQEKKIAPQKIDLNLPPLCFSRANKPLKKRKKKMSNTPPKKRKKNAIDDHVMLNNNNSAFVANNHQPLLVKKSNPYEGKIDLNLPPLCFPCANKPREKRKFAYTPPAKKRRTNPRANNIPLNNNAFVAKNPPSLLIEKRNANHLLSRKKPPLIPFYYDAKKDQVVNIECQNPFAIKRSEKTPWLLHTVEEKKLCIDFMRSFSAKHIEQLYDFLSSKKVPTLLKAKIFAHLSEKDAQGNTPFHDVAKEGNAKMLIFLVELFYFYASTVKNTNDRAAIEKYTQALINALFSKNKEGNTPLHMALKNGHALCAQIILILSQKFKANNTINDANNMLNNAKMTPLHYAVLSQLPQVISLLLFYCHRDHRDEKNKWGLSPLDILGIDLKSNHPERVQKAERIWQYMNEENRFALIPEKIFPSYVFNAIVWGYLTKEGGKETAQTLMRSKLFVPNFTTADGKRYFDQNAGANAHALAESSSH